MLRSDHVVLRELQQADARALLDVAAREEVTRFAWPAPDGVTAVERFIALTHQERRIGRYLCFGIFPGEHPKVAGLFELRRLQPDFFRAEAGFFIAPEFWGTGLFPETARLVLDFAFDVVGIHRIEARVVIDNDRSSAALQKLGAIREGVLRDAFIRDGEYVDQVMWALLRRRWSGCREIDPPY